MLKDAMGGFMQFIKEQNVVGAAVGIIMGLKVGEVVKSLVEDVLMPAIFAPALKTAGVEKIADLSMNGIFYGKFLGTFIDFLIVAFVVYFIVNTFAKKFMPEKK